MVFLIKKTYGYVERSEKDRAKYLEILNQYPQENIIYIDESGIDDNATYPYAWGPKGQRVYGMKNGKRKQRISIVGALNQNKIKASFVFEGMCYRELFEVFITQVLLPVLIPGQVV